MKRAAILIVLLLLTSRGFAQLIEKGSVSLNSNVTHARLIEKQKKGMYYQIQVNLMPANSQVTGGNGNYYRAFYSTTVTADYNNTNNAKKLTLSPSVHASSGYWLNRHFSAGAGMGFEFFDHFLFPLFAEFRYTVKDRKISPFLNLKGGYSLGNFNPGHYDHLILSWSPYRIEDASLRHFGGIMLHPEIGIKVPLDGKDDILITAAYRYQETLSVLRKEYENNQWEEWEHKGNLNRISLGVAIMFR